LAQLPVHEGDVVDRRETMRKVDEAAHAFDEHLRVSYSPRVNGGNELAIVISTPDALAPPPPPPPPPPSQLQAPAGAIRIGANVAAANILTKVTPVYPALAKAARVQGVVKFEVVIGKEGTIQNLRLIDGPPLLVEAALEAVEQWVYRPTLLNGAPVEVLTLIDINFTLAQ
jgi:protein TonB